MAAAAADRNLDGAYSILLFARFARVGTKAALAAAAPR